MKKLVFVISVMLLAVSLNAETFRQSIGKENFVLSLSYEDLEINNKMSSSNTSSPISWNATYDAPVKRDIIMLKGAYGIHKYLDIYAGIGHVKETWNAKNKLTGANYTEQKGKDYAYEIGIKGTAYKFLNDSISLAYLLKYNYLKTGEDSYTGSPNPSAYKAAWKEFTMEIELGYNIPSYGLTAFSGLGYLDLEVTQDLDFHHNIYENKDDIFYFIGLTKKIQNNFYITSEAQFVAKESILLGVSYKF